MLVNFLLLNFSLADRTADHHHWRGGRGGRWRRGGAPAVNRCWGGGRRRRHLSWLPRCCWAAAQCLLKEIKDPGWAASVVPRPFPRRLTSILNARVAEILGLSRRCSAAFGCCWFQRRKLQTGVGCRGRRSLCGFSWVPDGGAVEQILNGSLFHPLSLRFGNFNRRAVNVDEHSGVSDGSLRWRFYSERGSGVWDGVGLVR